MAEPRSYETSLRWPLPAAVVAWLAVAWLFGQLLVNPPVRNVSPDPIEARIVELPESTPPPAPSRPAPPPPKPKAVAIKKPEPAPLAPAPPTLAPPEPKPPATQTEPEPPTPVPQNTHAPAETALGARAIYQPVPKIPDELREEALRAVALARFHVREDGTVTVELLTPTPDPRINQLILNTLSTWRFFPAMKDGKPQPSVQEIKIHVDID